MTLGLLFWLLVVFTLLFDLWTYHKDPNEAPVYPWLGLTFKFVLILLLGWQVFGPALHR